MSQLMWILSRIIALPILLAIIDLQIGQIAEHPGGYLGLMKLLQHLVSIACSNDHDLAQGMMFVWEVFSVYVGLSSMFTGWRTTRS